MSQSEDSSSERCTRSTSAKKEKGKMATTPAPSKEKLSTEAMFESISLQLTTLQTDVKELKKIQGTVETLKSDSRGYDDRIKDLEDMVGSDNLQIKLLTNVVIKQEHEIEILKSIVKSYQRKEIKHNMIFGGLIEHENENCVKIVKDFMANEMKIAEHVTILDAYRQGPKKKDKPEFVRNIVAKLKNITDKGIIFSHVSNLAGKKNVRKKLFVVTDHLIEEDRETRQLYQELSKENKKKYAEDDEDHLLIKMKKNTIMIEGNPLQRPVDAPKNSEILKLADTEKEMIRQFKTANGKTHSEKGSEFYSHSAKVCSIRDVTRAYLKMRLKYGDATHIMCAYRLAEPDGPFDQQAIDDGEYGGARRILDELTQKEAKNVAVFVARYHPTDAVNLGLRHFDIIKDLARSAYKAHLDRMNKRRIWQHSQGSLASALSSADDEYHTFDQDSTASNPTDDEETQPKQPLTT